MNEGDTEATTHFELEQVPLQKLNNQLLSLNGVEFTLFFPNFTLLSADQADNIFSVPPVNYTGKTEGEWD